MIITFSPHLHFSPWRWISRLVLCPLYRKRRLVEQHDWLFNDKWQGDSVPPGPFSLFLCLSLWPGGHTLDFILQAPQPLASSWGQPREGMSSKREKGCVINNPPTHCPRGYNFNSGCISLLESQLLSNHFNLKKKKKLGFSQLLLKI